MTAFILIFLLVFGVIVGNLLWLRPGAQERALIAQRARASASGLRVLLRPAPEWLSLPAGQRLVGQYHLTQASRPEAQGRWRWHEGLGNWQPVENPDAWLKPAPWPTPAPAGWLGVDVRPQEVVLYWREDGRSDAIDQLLTHLRQVSA